MNYDKLLQELIDINVKNNVVPSLILHSCCAPCSSYVIEYLANYFYITILYYNPNISPIDEYLKRKDEQIRLIKSMKTKYEVKIMDCDYDNDLYEKVICGLEMEPERGRRCTVCFNLRLDKTAEVCLEHNFDYFATTLTLSPYKNAKLINEKGFELGNKLNVKNLASDFKKRNGYKRSIELSHKYNLYRQDYCGCKYSKKIKREVINEKAREGEFLEVR